MLYDGESEVEIDALHYHGPLNAAAILVELLASPTPLCVANVATSGLVFTLYGLYVSFCIVRAWVRKYVRVWMRA